MQSGHKFFSGFMDDIQIWNTASSANNVIQRYMTARAGSYTSANNACVLHIKGDSTYGNKSFTDSSSYGHTITAYGQTYHHIEDDRTANTALYFDGYSMIRLPNTTEMKLGADGADYCIEAWVKPEQGNGFLLSSSQLFTSDSACYF